PAFHRLLSPAVCITQTEMCNGNFLAGIFRRASLTRSAGVLACEFAGRPVPRSLFPSVRQRAGLGVRLLVATRFIRLHPGAQKGNAANYWSLFEPHYKQNLSANPKRTAKSSLDISDARHLNFVQIIFSSSNPFCKSLSKNFRLLSPTSHRSHGNKDPSREAKGFFKNFIEENLKL